MQIGIGAVGVMLAMIAITPAQAAPPPWQGIWDGRIGTLPVTVCLRREDYVAGGYPHGSYYYHNQGKIIPLAQRAGTKLWIEGFGNDETRSQPAWMFSETGPARLTGRWTKEGVDLPFALARKQGTGAAAPCGDYTFNDGRITKTVIRTFPARLGPSRYTRLIYKPGPQFEISVESFALPVGGPPGDAKVNALLRKDLPRNLRRNDYLDCEFGGVANGNRGGSYNSLNRPTLMTRNWLATETASGFYCGGAHPETGTDFRIFDRRAGREVDAYRWMTGAAFERVGTAVDGYWTMTARFRRFILPFQSDPQPECRETLEAAEFWTIGISRSGIVFLPHLAHVNVGCEDSFTVPYARMQPWLMPPGRATVAAIRADLVASR